MKHMTKYFLMACICSLVACQNISKQFKQDKPPVSNEVLDTIRTAPLKVSASPAIFETAFVNGSTQKINDATISLYGITIGKLKVVSGQIIACDPLHIGEYGIPFTQLFPLGEFPVQLSIAKLAEEETVAFARIHFSDEPVVKWQMALLEGQEPIPVGDKKIKGYGVDGGMAIFMDKEAIKAMTKEQLTQIEDGIYKDIKKEMDTHYHNDWKYTMHTIGNHSIAAFTTGFGDGRYATYIGFDANGQPCQMVSDFQIFDWRSK